MMTVIKDFIKQFVISSITIIFAQQQNETSSMYANWAEIQQLANNQNHRSESSAKLAPKNLPDVVIGKPAAPERSPTTLLSKTSAPLPGDDATRTRHHHHRSAIQPFVTDIS
jgi:hypothetical protein